VREDVGESEDDREEVARSAEIERAYIAEQLFGLACQRSEIDLAGGVMVNGMSDAHGLEDAHEAKRVQRGEGKALYD